MADTASSAKARGKRRRIVLEDSSDDEDDELALQSFASQHNRLKATKSASPAPSVKKQARAFPLRPLPSGSSTAAAEAATSMAVPDRHHPQPSSSRSASVIRPPRRRHNFVVEVEIPVRRRRPRPASRDISQQPGTAVKEEPVPTRKSPARTSPDSTSRAEQKHPSEPHAERDAEIVEQEMEQEKGIHDSTEDDAPGSRPAAEIRQLRPSSSINSVSPKDSPGLEAQQPLRLSDIADEIMNDEVFEVFRPPSASSASSRAGSVSETAVLDKPQPGAATSLAVDTDSSHGSPVVAAAPSPPLYPPSPRVDPLSPPPLSPIRVDWEIDSDPSDVDYANLVSPSVSDRKEARLLAKLKRKTCKLRKELQALEEETLQALTKESVARSESQSRESDAKEATSLPPRSPVSLEVEPTAVEPAAIDAISSLPSPDRSGSPELAEPEEDRQERIRSSPIKAATEQQAAVSTFTPPMSLSPQLAQSRPMLQLRKRPPPLRPPPLPRRVPNPHYLPAVTVGRLVRGTFGPPSPASFSSEVAVPLITTTEVVATASAAASGAGDVVRRTARVSVPANSVTNIPPKVLVLPKRPRKRSRLAMARKQYAWLKRSALNDENEVVGLACDWDWGTDDEGVDFDRADGPGGAVWSTKWCHEGLDEGRGGAWCAMNMLDDEGGHAGRRWAVADPFFALSGAENDGDADIAPGPATPAATGDANIDALVNAHEPSATATSRLHVDTTAPQTPRAEAPTTAHVRSKSLSLSISRRPPLQALAVHVTDSESESEVEQERVAQSEQVVELEEGEIREVGVSRSAATLQQYKAKATPLGTGGDRTILTSPARCTATATLASDLRPFSFPATVFTPAFTSSRTSADAIMRVVNHVAADGRLAARD